MVNRKTLTLLAILAPIAGIIGYQMIRKPPRPPEISPPEEKPSIPEGKGSVRVIVSSDKPLNITVSVEGATVAYYERKVFYNVTEVDHEFYVPPGNYIVYVRTPVWSKEFGVAVEEGKEVTIRVKIPVTGRILIVHNLELRVAKWKPKETRYVKFSLPINTGKIYYTATPSGCAVLKMYIDDVMFYDSRSDKNIGTKPFILEKGEHMLKVEAELPEECEISNIWLYVTVEAWA